MAVPTEQASSLMAMHTPSDIWSHVRDRVRDELDNPNYDYLLEGTSVLKAAADTLTVAVPTQFARDWLDARLVPELEEFLCDITGKPWRLTLTVASGPVPNGSTASGASQEPVQRAEQRRQIPGQQQLSFEEPPPEPRRARPTLAGGVLNPRYTFESFVVGSSNRFAYAAALAVGKRPATDYNPLFIYGGVGLGKTHLMHAMGHFAIKHQHGLHVVYVTSERFTNDMVNSLMTKSMTDFRNKYRQADILLIDDIQFVAGKEQTQEEIFHTFNALHEAGKQIVISSDRLPREIPTLEDRLRSRFEWGLTADIQPPDFETRIAILRKKAITEGYPTSNEVLAFIAKHVHSNIRELEGALIRVMAYSELHGSPLTEELAQEALRDMVEATPVRQITIELIQQEVASYFGIKTSDMRSKKRSRDVTFPRQIAMYLARELTEASLPRIGEGFGGRDHTTVMHACDKIRGESEFDSNLAAIVRELRARIETP